MKELARDPYNIIITGVGGQGNVMASRLLGNMLSRGGYRITIGETFGVSQRGGSVMSHMRISKKSAWSPQIPKGRADVIVALEPIEAVRVMAAYGNTGSMVIANTRPIYPVQVIAGELEYPSMEKIKDSLSQLTGWSRFLNATEEALILGSPILGNVIMIGALSAMDVLPFGREDFQAVIAENLSADKVDINMKAFDRGAELLSAAEVY
ncbi:MAG: indolepyruvate oxidoreductase subunit beta, partial [Spirochaetes bacterium]|nr:indolepyruvate oxidoreductase subunit beta [Spirochaetota bacterium]